MKITGVDNEMAKHIGQTGRTCTEELADKPRMPADPPPETTEDAVVNLSQRSREIQLAKEAMDSQPDVRLDRVLAIKQEIEHGTYVIDYDKTAEKMLKAFSE